jgi:enoyl-CoA hydratase/carnithine racemase
MEHDMNELISLERAAANIAVLTLNRPDKKNALSIAMRDEVSGALDILKHDETLRCLILTGTGSAFSAGFDLSEFQVASSDPDFRKQLWASSDRYHETLLSFPLPILAALNGPALGGGMDTAVLCDIRIAANTTRLGHPESAFGDVIYAPLHDLIGGAAARELCLTGRIVDPTEALRLGRASEVVPAIRLTERALAIAGNIAKGPRDVVQRTKAKIIARAAIQFRTTLEL